MRESVPAQFEAKKEKYLSIAASILRQHSIPDELIYGIDETSCLFVQHAKKTRAPQGAKRVRLVGVGKDKSQITLTLGGSASGRLLPVQYIFGGSTARCHPFSGKQAPPPDGSYFTHTQSHWQTPDSFREYIEKVIVPAKNAAIQKLGLDPTSQYTLLKLDLHYSHMDQIGSTTLRDLLLLHKIVTLYVGNACSWLHWHNTGVWYSTE